jgi:membrane carboxypeptidase/penicillin-binding protein PbpC
MVEWFVPGTEPARMCDWHRDGRVHLPPEYAEWAEQTGSRSDVALTGQQETPVKAAVPRAADEGASAAPSAHGEPFRILSPEEGDKYRIPPGIEARYATIALRAAGGTGAIRWWIDGRPTPTTRWQLVPGTHTIRAVTASGDSAEVRIAVEWGVGATSPALVP